MLRSKFQRRLAAAALSALFAATVGCASPPKPAVCAAIGGVLLGGGGAALGAATPDPDSREIGLYAGAGAIAGAGAGYLICRAMQKEAPPPPKPAPPPPPKPAPPPPPPPEEKIVLRGVNFDFNKSNIRPDAAVILDEAASILKANPSRSVKVAGYTDSVGSDKYNQGLSERRAKSVRDYLVSKGVDASRLTSMGFGESNPIATNDTAEGRALNRRVELNLD